MMLALRLGRTLEELGETMSGYEFSLWVAMYNEDLWGEMREYERAGVIAATVANYAGMMRAKGERAAVPKDFMPRIKDEPVEQEMIEEPDPVAFFTAIANTQR